MTPAKTLLFVDDDTQLVSVMAQRAESLGLNVLTAHNAFTALNHIERRKPDIICLDVRMPTANGLSIAESLLSPLNANPAKLIVLTGCTDDETQDRCRRLGARYIVKGIDCWNRLEPVIREFAGLPMAMPASPERERIEKCDEPVALIDEIFTLLGASESLLDQLADVSEEMDARMQETPWVLCIEDDQDFSLALQLRLEQRGVSVVRSMEGRGGIRAANQGPVSAILLDYNLPNGRGDFVLKRLKANPKTEHIPVIVVSGQKTEGLEKELLHLGAERFFSKPIKFDTLFEELQKHIVVPTC